jgi:myo-inositol-1(or 4)-monophosphatase
MSTYLNTFPPDACSALAAASVPAELIEVVEEAVLDAARSLLDAASSGAALEVTVKADHSLVMNLDLECQRRILSRLGGRYPVVAEEDDTSHDLINRADSFFLVDPLDGTTTCKRFLGQWGGQVGYGPLVGLVLEGVLTLSSFYSVPHHQLFTAVRGAGVFASEVTFQGEARPRERRRLQPAPCTDLHQAGVVFLLGKEGEARVAELLKRSNAVDNLYRFGGFANDCARLAQGFEQVCIQFSVKPWDFSAALLAAEAGLEVWIDPAGRRTPLQEWRIAANNPLCILHPGIRDQLFGYFDQVRSP